MSRTRVIIIACLLTALACVSVAAPGAASARQAQQVATAKGSLVPVRMSGQLTVQFHGAGSAGCARWGLCAYSGTVTWRPPSAATLVIARSAGPHPRFSVGLLATELFGSGGGTTTADVTLAGGGSGPPAAHCSDAVSDGGDASFPVHGGRATVSLRRMTSSLLATRCAGPRDSDVFALLPQPVVAVSTLDHKGTVVSLVTAAALDAHGFEGSVSSSLKMQVGRPAPFPTLEGQGSGHGSGGVRFREIDVHYRASVTGSIQEDVQAATNPLVCGPLGSCGLHGTVTLTPHARHVAIDFSAGELASQPKRDLLAAVGLAPGSPHGLTAAGIGTWSDGGSVRSDVSQGTERCQDTAPLGLGTLVLASSGDRVQLAYGPGSLLAASPVATDCPGPLPTGATPAMQIAALAALRRRTIRLALTARSTAFDDGYVVHFVPHLTVTLTRERVRLSTIRLPADL